MNNYDLIVERLISFSISSVLLERCLQFLNRVNLIHSDYINTLDINNITMSFSDEVSIEWYNGTNYMFIKIRENDIRLDSKIDGERFSKFHPVINKIFPALSEYYEKLMRIR